MRAKQTGLGVLLVCGALGCFEAVSELNEAEEVAEALTRAVRFDGGDVVDGNLPESDATEISILPPSLPTVMSPGQASLMGFDTPGTPAEPSEYQATLVQFAGSRKHIRVGHPPSVEGQPGHFEHSFEVDSDVCDGLCNKQHPVKLSLALKLRDGRVSKRHDVTFTLDCSERGDASACKASGASGGIGDPLVLLDACENAAGVCASFADEQGISSNVSQCVSLYGCVLGYFAGDSYCQGLVNDVVQCMASAGSSSTCNGCSAIAQDLVDSCTFPAQCLDAAMGVDAGPIVGRFDASVPDPGGSDSLGVQCSMMCAEAANAGCPNFTDTCQSDCESGFLGTPCEKAVVEMQRCIYEASGRRFTCDADGMPELAADSSACMPQSDALTDCLVANPELLDQLVDGGVPMP